MKVEIWSDVVCPWCYVGKRRFEAALEEFAHADRVEVTWRSFELDPAAPSGPDADGSDYAGRLAQKYGTTRAGAQEMLDSMTEVAAGEGLDLRFDLAVRANTFDAHQVLHLAGRHGLQDRAKERLLRGYFTEGLAVGERATLVRLAVEAGLDGAEVEHALETQRYAAEVRADEEEAASLGISGVPFFVVDRRYGVSGAQPAAQLAQVLRRAWDEGSPRLRMAGSDADGGTCGPDGCAI